MKLNPLDDYVVISQKAAEEKSPGGIVIPDRAKEKPQRGEVLAVGPGRMLENGTRAALAVSVGDEVLFSRYSGQEVEHDGHDVLLIKESNILAVIK